MLPKSCYILEARLANKLARASLKAGEDDWMETVAVLYAKRQRIVAGRPLRNTSQEESSWECDKGQFEYALGHPPRGANAKVFFHSHPMSHLPSRNDILSSHPRLLAMIFDCPNCGFHLYKYDDQARQCARRAKDGIPFGRAMKLFEKCRVPLYLETGIQAFDRSVTMGIKHPRMIAELKAKMRTYVGDTLDRISRRAEESIQSRMRESILDRFFRGLEHYADLRGPSGPKLKGLSDREEDILHDACSAYYSLGSYEITAGARH